MELEGFYHVYKSSLLVRTLSQIIQSANSHSIPLRFVLILSSNLRLGFPSDLLFSGYTTRNVVWIYRLSYSCYIPLPSYSLEVKWGAEHKPREG
jgi:hypothetical protein